jgi:hypothetical protein
MIVGIPTKSVPSGSAALSGVDRARARNPQPHRPGIDQHRHRRATVAQPENSTKPGLDHLQQTASGGPVSSYYQSPRGRVGILSQPKTVVLGKTKQGRTLFAPTPSFYLDSTALLSGIHSFWPISIKSGLSMTVKLSSSVALALVASTMTG